MSALKLYNCRNSLVGLIYEYRIFKRSLDEGIFPAVWKICNATLILKFGVSSLVSNYRPISILPHLAELFESIIYLYIKRSFIHILVDELHGFRPGESTATSRLSFISYILDSFED